eukprot:TRINITY_DN18434_c0_g1_i1.p1 TRINITY_DN18434_c0_g1~~TRINITY_DN18434_c0_g1_i1.p1  ORF type:complete len:618 (+),score=172.39 TRINITY_DN18434_c0_g1_i1:62-1915(+)
MAFCAAPACLSSLSALSKLSRSSIVRGAESFQAAANCSPFFKHAQSGPFLPASTNGLEARSSTFCAGDFAFSKQWCKQLSKKAGPSEGRQGLIRAIAAAPAEAKESTGTKDYGIRVRFAPSPTGNLHVGGARTALFNWLFARSQGGKFILRVEDTDLERSTKESELAVLRDLEWMGIEWDEGPDKGGEYGPYRQSERKTIYKEYVDKLVAANKAYPCFCTDEELAAQRAEQEAKSLPPKYAGKWATASKEEVEEELRKGTPHTYRFRVPDGRVVIQDMIRGEVAWANDTLGDFIILRSNGLPVYNFCVAIDDATMHVSHVIRAEEHLPNTLRQVLVYEALGFQQPKFGHVSLILAPDRSKLSKRHGATSVGEFAAQGFLPVAMVNYLSLLGWNDGTEDEIFSVQDLVQKFSIDRVTKSAAIFDKTKLLWINGQHIRLLPPEEVNSMLGQQWVSSGILKRPDGPFVDMAAELIKDSLEVIADADHGLNRLLNYPLREIIASGEVNDLLEDNLAEVASAIVKEFDDGKLTEAVRAGHDGWQAWIKGIGKAMKRKGKRLFMPARVLLTGTNKGPDVGTTLELLAKGVEEDIIGEKADFVSLADRIEILRSTDLTPVKKEE